MTAKVWGETRMTKLLRPLPATKTLAHVRTIPVAVPAVLVAIAMLLTTPAVAVAISRMIEVLPISAPISAGCSMLTGTAVLATLR